MNNDITKGSGTKTGPGIGLKGKILGLILPITIIMVVILIVYSYTVSRANILSSSEDLLRTSAKDQANQIESWLNQKLKEINTVKYDIEHSDALTNDELMQQKLDSYYGLDSSISGGFYLSDLDGNVMMASDRESSISNPTDQVWFKEGLTRRNAGYTKMYQNQDGVNVISACGMLNDMEHVRVFSADMALDSVNIIVNSSVSMPKAESLLVDKTDGTILVAREGELVSKTLASTSDPFLKSMADRVAKGDYSLTTTDGNMEVMKEISGTDWVLVSYISMSDVTQTVNSLRTRLVIISLLLILLIAGLSYVTVHIAVKPLRELTGKLKAMSDGDFTITVEPKGRDEIAEIERSVKVFIESMRNMIQEIIDISDKLKTQADASSTVSGQMFESSKAQADSMSSMNSTMDQFSISINEIAQSATELSGVVSDTTEDGNVVKDRIDTTVDMSQKGRADMQRVDEAMVQIRQSIDTLVEAVNKVGNASKEITGIIGLIGEISEETALLSLNASIEAARAGEAGRGFAVVASEISKLAETTANSVDNISNLIEEVDSLIAAAVKQADVSVDRINNSSDRIRVAVNTFDEIYKHIQSVDEVINKMVEEVQIVNGVAMDVSAISEEQAASTDVVHETSERMVLQAEELAEESQRVAESAGVLTETSEELNRHMNKFQI